MNKVICFSLLHLIFSFTFSPVNSRENGASLIDTTCKTTPFYNLCVSALQSDPHSSSADIPGLAQIGANKVKAKATATLRQITALLKEAKDQSLKKALLDCLDYYNAIVDYDVPTAIDAVVKGDPKFGLRGLNDAANEALACERRFEKQPKFPIEGDNKVVHDLSTVASSIVALML
ncbi:Poly(A) polymerase, putative isoform 1 [Hibiscus syriacus]|uniref:Poly(A) polymerase, putative isoform 1 n=1 Tax=Hibiscus syriacus TaxID=106335 RepID=A0A6A3CPY7_HIBSY|nr:cell wall / vacuolar inhibitor of fructosidase 1-like [Hibiscus syriacus]KAE8730966.1 Poly(A) polymerase, putative isoform 1 [Hibiscus syriacus]